MLIHRLAVLASTIVFPALLLLFFILIYIACIYTLRDSSLLTLQAVQSQSASKGNCFFHMEMEQKISRTFDQHCCCSQIHRWRSKVILIPAHGYDSCLWYRHEIEYIKVSENWGMFVLEGCWLAKEFSLKCCLKISNFNLVPPIKTEKTCNLHIGHHRLQWSDQSENGQTQCRDELMDSHRIIYK